MRLNYSWRWRERSCKSLHLHFSAPGCAAQQCTQGDGVNWGKKACDYPCRLSIPHGLAGVCVCVGGVYANELTNCLFLVDSLPDRKFKFLGCC